MSDYTDEEVWRYVKGYGRAYSVSNLGRVRSNERTVRHSRYGTMRLKSHIMRGSQVPRPSVQLSKNGRLKTYYVHRLVAKAFLGPCPNGKEVNHLDGNGWNNRVDNLEYVTRKENMRHAYENGLCHRFPRTVGDDHPGSKLTLAQVREIRESEGSCREVASRYDVSRSAINRIRTGRNWSEAQ